MALKKTKKRRKGNRMRATSTHGGGARKQRKKSGHHGGPGMAGSGKRADHKKTLITKLFGNTYFGKQGVTSRKTEKDKRKRISVRDVELNVESYLKKGLAKKTSKGLEINLKDYKILDSKSKDYIPKEKMIINAKEASASAIKKVEKAGGEILIPSGKKEE